MNNKAKPSIFAVAKKNLVAMRKKWGIKNRYNMNDIAQRAGLPVEYLDSLPQSVAGFLDGHNEPRFIAVNRQLPPHDQAFFIARQIASIAHNQRLYSLVLDRPWKWATLDAAPDDLKEKVIQLDTESRAHWLMLGYATGDEFRAFVRASPKRIWSGGFNDNIVRYHLSKVWVRLWFAKVYRRITFAAFRTV